MNRFIHQAFILGLTATCAWGPLEAFSSRPKTDAVKAETAPPKDASSTKDAGKEPEKASIPVSIDAFSDALNALAEKTLPAVVNISTTQVLERGKEKMPEIPDMMPGNPFRDMLKDFFEQYEQRPRKVQSLGSGFIIRIDGNTAYIVTNNHVIAEAKKILITLAGKQEFEATVHAVDSRTDLAVLSVDISTLEKSKRPTPLEWSNSEKARVGHIVAAIGNAFGLGSTFTMGVISFTGRDLMTRRSEYVDDFIQHSAPINMGNSGGCLLDTAGRVVGVNTAIFTPSGGNVGIGFAIPATIAKATVDQLIEFKRTKRGWIGVHIQPMTDDMAESLGLKTKGAIVGDLTPGGPADKATIQANDVITEFDGKTLGDGNKIARLVGETPIGKEVVLKIWRKGKEETLKLTVGEFDEAANKTAVIKDGKKAPVKEADTSINVLGMHVRARGANEAKGILVERVDQNSNAEDIGVQRNDVIHEANQKELKTPQEFDIIVNEAKTAKRKNILLLIHRNGEPRFVSLKIEPENETPKADEKDKEAKK